MNAATDGSRPLRILHLEDSPLDAELIREWLRAAGLSMQLDWAANEQEFTSLLQRGTYDLILADYRLPGFDAPAALVLTKSLCPGIPFIAVTGAVGEEEAVEFLKRGATDYVLKGKLSKLPGAIQRAMAEFRERQARRQAEEALHRLNRELQAASHCNQVLVRAEDEQSLLDSICRIVCEEAGYCMTWVGYAEHDEAKTLRPVTKAGSDTGYLEQARITWADTEWGSEPCGVAIRTGETFSIDNFISDRSEGGWREAALQRGYRSCIALPLKDESANTFGVFGIYSTEANTFTVEEQRLLAELAGDLAFGIVSLRTRVERKAAERRIEHLAFYDPLTELPNRRLLMDRLQQTMSASARTRNMGALLFIDLDNFKLLNDTCGHDVGDHLLIEVAHRLGICVRDGDTISRLGGDEFVVMLGDLSENPTDAATQTKVVGEKILSVLNQPYAMAGRIHHSAASIGATLFIDTENSVDELLKQADIAMYQAKSAGRNTLSFFDPDMQAALAARADLEAALRQGIQDEQFALHYQAQVLGVDGVVGVVGAEVLLRWNHPERGMIPPAQFIPLAEETGLILPLGQWVLEEACARLGVWSRDPRHRDLYLSVNVSARQFRQGNFVDQVRLALESGGAPATRLKLELTESLVLDDVDDTIQKMHMLKELGVSFSMDDFGTGYSSLSYLTRLPLDQLKIDQSFIRNLPTNPNDAVVVHAIITLAQSLGLDVIAEGVETEAQRQFLAQNGCPAFQGYLFSKPVALADFEALLQGLAIPQPCARPEVHRDQSEGLTDHQVPRY